MGVISRFYCYINLPKETFWPKILGVLNWPTLTLNYLDHNGNHVLNNRREALLRIEEAAAKGQSPISPDYAPAELVESMVPPPGDWEKIWLARQPTTMVRGANKWMW